MRKFAIFILSLTLLASCRDFNPVTDSSVRTVRFTVDPRSAFDSMMVVSGDTVVLENPMTPPEGYCLRTEVLCYDQNGTLVKKAMCYHDSITPFSVSLERIDTAGSYHFVFLTDIVRMLGDGMYQYTWPTFDPGQQNTLYAMYVSSYGNTEGWLNSLAFGEWDGEPNTTPHTIVMRPATCCAMLKMCNCHSYDKIHVEIGQPTSFWLNPLSLRRGAIGELCQILPISDESIMPFVSTSQNARFYIYVIATSVNKTDTTTLKLKAGGKPFVITYDCKTKKHEMTEL